MRLTFDPTNQMFGGDRFLMHEHQEKERPVGRKRKIIYVDLGVTGMGLCPFYTS